ncbi:DUF1565 domain-containing protein [Termitidicoccus mucosus]|uniref:Right handed beta helix domain-containing protein n=1 Tax=Termitidicoccus mucosus TaxID=1184151 RepID=A0A178IP07_9BACT|nr:hypothetical protein AW736_05560 [Opitutaceae bacterium TSB47]
MRVSHHIASLLFSAIISFAALAPSHIRAAAVTAGPPAQAKAAKPSAPGKYYFVDRVRGDDANGNGSRTRPWASITHALASVESPPIGAKPVVILISQGRYAEPTLVLKPRVNLSGGYTAFGREDTGELTRDCWNTPTILDGGGDRRIAMGADETKLDGLRFENGFAHDAGAAILCDGTSPSISGCVFVGNRVAGSPRPTETHGGAIACINGAAPYIVHNIIFDNSTGAGAASAFLACGGAAPRLKSNVFFNNQSAPAAKGLSSAGAVISYSKGCRGEITGNIVIANFADTSSPVDGGIRVTASTPTITGNIVVACESITGAMLIYGRSAIKGDATKPEIVRIDRNIIAGNSLLALVIHTVSAHLAHNVVAENTGGIILFDRALVTAERNTLWQENWSVTGIQHNKSPSHFTGSIFKNIPEESNGSPALFSRNLIADASAPVFHDAIPMPEGGENALFRDDSATNEIIAARYDAARFVTVFTLAKPVRAATRDYEYCARPVRIMFGAEDDMPDQWRVVKSAVENEVLVWGRLDEPPGRSGHTPKALAIMRSYLTGPAAPKDVGADYIILPNN